jgi:serine/threonine protein kinase
MNNVPTPSACPRCGAPVSAATVEGLCPRCLLAANLAGETGLTAATAMPGRPATEPPSAAEVARLFPQLEVVRLIGRGGMGAVYQARQTALDRFVALKLLTAPVDDRGFAERFTREARALARLNHPNIVTVHDFGEREGRYFLLMEFVDGVNLRELLKRKSITPEQALAIVPKICDALQFAHTQGIVHRDIKPENILLDRHGRVKIADFGIAKLLNPSTPLVGALTGAADRVGTPHYMAPEQIEHADTVDHRADIYSLGVVFYELLTGELPLGRFAPPSQKVSIDVRLDEVVLRALEKEPALRFQQVGEVKTEVETIVASPASAERRSNRSRRGLWTAFAGAVAITAAITVAIVSWLQPPPYSNPVLGLTYENAYPVVVRTWPVSGTANVEPGEVTLSVTFSKPMSKATYTWGTPWIGANAVSLGPAQFDASGRTCTLRVRLEPGKTYGYTLNTGGKHNGFLDKYGTSSLPYLLVFSTRPATTTPSASPAAPPS